MRSISNRTSISTSGLLVLKPDFAAFSVNRVSGFYSEAGLVEEESTISEDTQNEHDKTNDRANNDPNFVSVRCFDLKLQVVSSLRIAAMRAEWASHSSKGSTPISQAHQYKLFF